MEEDEKFKSDPDRESNRERSRSRDRRRREDKDDDPERKRHKHHRHHHHHHRHHSRDDDHERHHRSRESRHEERNDEKEVREKVDDHHREERRERERERDRDYRDRDRDRDHRDREERRGRERDRDHRDQRDRNRDHRDHGPLMPSQHAIPPRQVVPSSTPAAVTATVIEPLAPGYGHPSKGISNPKSSSSSSSSASTSDDKIAKLFGYSADVNPFGDPNLTSQFVWKRKVEKDLATGKITREPTAEDLAKQRDEMMTEILRAKERRLKAEAEEEERERLRSEEARLRNSSEYAEWDQKEEDFHLRQVRDRSLLRIRDKRERPIDVLSKNSVVMSACSAGRDDDEEFLRFEVQIKSPLNVLKVFAKSAAFSPPPPQQHHHHHSSSSHSSRQQQSGPAHALSQLEQLKSEINEFIALERGVGSIADYFKHCYIVCEDEERRVRSIARGIESGQSAANIEAVEAEIEAMFLGKNDAQLGELEKEVRQILEQSRVRGNTVVGNALHFRQIQLPSTATGGEGGGGIVSGAIDSDYWESVLKSLLAARSRTSIKKMHEEQLLARLDQMEKRSEMRKRAQLNKSQNKTLGLPVKAPAPVVIKENVVIEKKEKEEEYGLPIHIPATGGLGNGEGGGGEEEEEEDEEYGAHKIPSSIGLVTGSAAAVDVAADARAVSIQKRIAELQTRGMIAHANKNDDEDDDDRERGGRKEEGDQSVQDDVDVAAFIDEAGRTLPTGFFESSLDAAAEVGLPPLSAQVGDAKEGGSSSSSSFSAAELLEKYRPRKPRFFNRVKSGYDWNRYNSAHYDRDNPPPKTVQGYKFTVFYPDLIDKSKTPSFKLEPAASQEFVIIRFKAGPPYEDIAFQIVNKEWDTGRLSGYRCVYDRGILQLFFNFKRARYRK